MAEESRAGIRAVAAVRHDEGGAAACREAVVDERPVALVYNGRSFAVMMATPVDLGDFGIGFSLAEGIVERAAEIAALEVRPVARGVEIHMTIEAGRAAALEARRRLLAGRSGCGLCGVDGFSEALRPIARLTRRPAIAAAAVGRAMAAFPAGQVLNAAVGGVHAAAFADASGAIVASREDVGRHNALDKLVGALAAAGRPGDDGFVVVSSRCSYEMVHKTAAAGIGTIVAVSAPTSLAIELADKVGLTLIAFARDGRFTAYGGDGVG